MNAHQLPPRGQLPPGYAAYIGGRMPRLGGALVCLALPAAASARLDRESVLALERAVRGSRFGVDADRIGYAYIAEVDPTDANTARDAERMKRAVTAALSGRAWFDSHVVPVRFCIGGLLLAFEDGLRALAVRRNGSLP